MNRFKPSQVKPNRFDYGNGRGVCHVISSSLVKVITFPDLRLFPCNDFPSTDSYRFYIQNEAKSNKIDYGNGRRVRHVIPSSLVELSTFPNSPTFSCNNFL